MRSLWAGRVIIIAVLALISAANADEIVKLPLPEDAIVLEMHGAITTTNAADTALFDLAMLQQLPPVRLATTTAVTDGLRQFDGFLLRDLLELVGSTGAVVTATALNDYAIDIDVADFYRFDVMIAYAMDGEPLLPSDKGPLWIVYPRDQHAELQDIRYDYRWVWQLARLDIK